MPDTNRSHALVRSPELVVASIYERDVGASLERVWENVYDWEHLPWLHSEAFDSIEKIASGAWGWHARVELRGAAKAEIELVTDRKAGRYVARTLTGAGAPTEIWTTLDPVAAERTAIRVEFCVPPMPEASLRRLGQGYVELYTLLWSQDEGMMQTRERALAERRGPASRSQDEMQPISLGRHEDVLTRLPLEVELAGERFRILQIEGQLIAHAVQCPHRLGPLDACDPQDGILVCPWHGYRFDPRTGRSVDGRGLRMRPAPQISIDESTGEVTLRPRHAEQPEVSPAWRSSS